MYTIHTHAHSHICTESRDTGTQRHAGRNTNQHTGAKYIPAHTFDQTDTYKYAHTHIRIHTNAHAYKFTHTHIHTYKRHTQAQTHVTVSCTRVKESCCIYTCHVYICTRIKNSCIHAQMRLRK